MGRFENICPTFNQSNGEDDSEWLILSKESGELIQATPKECTLQLGQLGEQVSSYSTPFTLLDGEKVLETEVSVVLELSSVDNAWLSTDRRHAEAKDNVGAMFITNYQVVFVPKAAEKTTKLCNNIPLGVIGTITHVPTHDETTGNLTFQLKCKDWRLVTFTFNNSLSCSKMYQQISKFAFACPEPLFSLDSATANQQHAFLPPWKSTPDIPDYSPPPQHRTEKKDIPIRALEEKAKIEESSEPAENSPSLLRTVLTLSKDHIVCQEYERLSLSPTTWRISGINQEHTSISSYPAKLIVPTCISDEVLCKASAFRSNGRIPTVCWVSPLGAAIARSSQPLVGLWSARSEEDEMLVQAIFNNNPKYASNPMYIVDCRPKLSAVGNMAKGLGYERVDCYSEKCEIVWMGVDNIHAMRDSFRHMYKLCLGNQSDHRWLSNLEYTKWLDHLHLVIVSSTKVVDKVQKGSSVLIHCSDGWDRTPQLVSLAMLLLDPYYRTIDGFIALIEKEWISFGHKFRLRSGHATHDFWTNDQCSPIFLQWVDCVWQITQQFPQRFEFNDKFLVDLVDNVYNCRFDEFLYNSEKERNTARQYARFMSLWNYYSSNSSEFLNPFYDPSEAGVLVPDTSPKIMRFWTGYYLRYYQSGDEGMNCILQQGRVLKDECSRLEAELQQMRTRLEQEAKTRESLEHKLESAEHETEELRKRTVGCKMTMEEGMRSHFRSVKRKGATFLSGLRTSPPAHGTVGLRVTRISWNLSRVIRVTTYVSSYSKGDTKTWYKIDLEDLGYPSTLKKLHFDIIEDYSVEAPSSACDAQLSPPSKIKQQMLLRKRSCP